MTEDFFEKLLNFGPEWKVERIDFNEDNEVDINLKWNLEVYKKVNEDNYEFVHDYRNYLRWRHLDILQFKTFINAQIPRIKPKLRIRDFKRINYSVIPYTTEPCSSLFVERNF